MKIHNLDARDRKVADLMWNCRSREELDLILDNLPGQDQLRAHMILEIASMGGDDITDVALAQQIIKKIQKR